MTGPISFSRLATTAASQPRDWRSFAVCREVDPELFFPTRETGSSSPQQVNEAKRVCAGCPVRSECLEFAMAAPQAGVWGGLSENERKLLRRRRARRLSQAGVEVAA